MNREPKISVIVLAYNQEHLIGRTLDSIVAQECDFPFEIIVGEDHSTDGTLKVCRRYAEKYPGIIRIFANSSNKGLLDNYYDCILEARGEYIADCGGDDFWIDTRKLQKQAALLDSDPKITIVHTGWNYYDENTGSTRRYKAELRHPGLLKPVSEPGELFVPMLADRGGPVIHLCTSMFRRDTLMKCYRADTALFRNKEFFCEDFQLSTSMAREGKVAYMPEVTLNYSVGKPSVMSEKSMRKIFSNYLSSIKLLHYIVRQNNVDSRLIAGNYADKLHYILTMAFRLGDRGMRDEVTRWYEKTGTTPSAKSRMLLALSANTALWRLSRTLQQTIKPFHP